MIGVAAKNEGISCDKPGAHGGNMDTKLVTSGATLYFPVFHEGGLLSLGDLHAAMGDGKISVFEIESSAQISINVIHHKRALHSVSFSKMQMD